MIYSRRIIKILKLLSITGVIFLLGGFWKEMTHNPTDVLSQGINIFSNALADGGVGEPPPPGSGETCEAGGCCG